MEGANRMIFSEQLSTLRRKADMTQEALAEKCDVSRQAVAKWESGESIPDIVKKSEMQLMLFFFKSPKTWMSF